MSAYIGPLALLGVVACSGPRAFNGFRTSDGFNLVADLSLPERTPAPLVVLGHQFGRDRHSWDPLVPKLLDAGYAVLRMDHRSLGESTREVPSPEWLTDVQKQNVHLDLLEAIDAVADRPDVDASRVAVIGSGGLSANSAVRCAMENPSVRAVVVLAGLIQAAEETYVLSHPELPILMISAADDEHGTYLMRQYAGRLTGPEQRYIEIEPAGPGDAADWEGTDGLRDETGLADLIVWFLERNVPTGSGEGGKGHPHPDEPRNGSLRIRSRASNLRG